MAELRGGESEGAHSASDGNDTGGTTCECANKECTRDRYTGVTKLMLLTQVLKAFSPLTQSDLVVSQCYLP